MAITKCKECGGKLSTKAETCPSCGTKVNAGQKAFAGCLGSLLSLAFFLWLGWLAVDFVSSKASQSEKKDPQALLKELDAKCATTVKEAPSSMGNKKDLYEKCVFGGRAQLRAQGQIE